MGAFVLCIAKASRIFGTGDSGSNQRPLVSNQEKQSPMFTKQEIASPSYTISFGGLLIAAFRGVAFFIPI